VLDVLEPVSLGTLWSMPEVTIYPAGGAQPRGGDLSAMALRDPGQGEQVSLLHRRTPPLPRAEENPSRSA
jgi:hypothetical protein